MNCGELTTECSMPKEEDSKKWKHLDGIKFPCIKDKEVMLLIGSDVPEAFWVIEKRRGGKKEPYATKSPLGWTLIGPTNSKQGRPNLKVNFARRGHGDDQLMEQLERFWKTDSSGSVFEDIELGESIEDKRARACMEESTVKVNGHYQLGLPWKYDEPILLDNRKMADKRLQCLKGRFMRDKALHESYSTTMADYIDNGFAEEVKAKQPVVERKEVMSNKTWFLPHHPVINQHKPGKVRIVFDCAAKYKGVSLNSQLLRGPDFTNNLVGVLTRFRQDKVALVADIQSMFHQVKVSPEDCGALQCLWWPNGNFMEEPKVYRMLVHLFGATSSPSCAGYALRRTAADNESEHNVAAVETVRNNFYVDDCLKSVKTTEEAIELSSQLRELLAKGGFRLTKWLSNDRQVLEKIPKSETAATVFNLDLQELPVERTLGVSWNVETDKFTFNVKVKERPNTRRGILSTTSSVYDPLGFVAPFILVAKMLLQDICTQGLGWDQEVSSQDLSRWTHWLEELPQLRNVSINRYTKSNPADEGSRGIHACEITEDCRWLRGPEFLWKADTEWPIMPVSIDNKDLEFKTPPVHSLACRATMMDVILRYSTWTKLLKGLAWLLKFKKYLLKKRKGSDAGTLPHTLSLKELKQAEMEIIKLVQHQEFGDDLCCKNRGKSIQKLNPVVIDGILRVGGRICNAPIDSDLKHPIILPSNHHVTELLIQYHHLIVGHSGAGMTWSSSRERYWIIKGGATVRKVIGNCFACKRRNTPRVQQMMGELPAVRVTPDKPPFTYVGIDYFGPLYVKQGRSKVKRYGCIFTCLTLRAVHIELANSLDTDSFLNALRRFIARRGKPEKIYSDNGTNFHDADRELRENLKILKQRKIENFLHEREIEWVFNPPTASHMGGAWERLIRSTRKILKNLLGEQVVCDEVLATVMTEVEGILNARPLTEISLDARDCEPLTPNHLILMKQSPSLPPGVFDKKDYGKRRWRQAQYLASIFWKRWRKEYLPLLQTKQRWTTPNRNIKVNDLVLVVDDNAPRDQWPLGRVVKVFPGKDGMVRQVEVRLGSKVLMRPVAKLCLLERANTD
ncbi:uncharacterized protein LOC117107502 [Anneissia japonica]|uniref:uncharacterized protein LOC117107502 n=1 Tax=Anneissia japonica TaxID=1529436 RepID=UPI0014257A40|nr:uncharacterized protein LOC117107502 [Anneissia japonica]